MINKKLLVVCLSPFMLEASIGDLKAEDPSANQNLYQEPQQAQDAQGQPNPENKSEIDSFFGVKQGTEAKGGSEEFVQMPGQDGYTVPETQVASSTNQMAVSADSNSSEVDPSSGAAADNQIQNEGVTQDAGQQPMVDQGGQNPSQVSVQDSTVNFHQPQSSQENVREEQTPAAPGSGTQAQQIDQVLTNAETVPSQRSSIASSGDTIEAENQNVSTMQHPPVPDSASVPPELHSSSNEGISLSDIMKPDVSDSPNSVEDSIPTVATDASVVPVAEDAQPQTTTIAQTSENSQTLTSEASKRPAEAAGTTIAAEADKKLSEIDSRVEDQLEKTEQVTTETKQTVLNMDAKLQSVEEKLAIITNFIAEGKKDETKETSVETKVVPEKITVTNKETGEKLVIDNPEHIASVDEKVETSDSTTVKVSETITAYDKDGNKYQVPKSKGTEEDVTSDRSDKTIAHDKNSSGLPKESSTESNETDELSPIQESSEEQRGAYSEKDSDPNTPERRKAAESNQESQSELQHPKVSQVEVETLLDRIQSLDKKVNELEKKTTEEPGEKAPSNESTSPAETKTDNVAAAPSEPKQTVLVPNIGSPEEPRASIPTVEEHQPQVVETKAAEKPAPSTESVSSQVPVTPPQAVESFVSGLELTNASQAKVEGAVQTKETATLAPGIEQNSSQAATTANTNASMQVGEAKVSSSVNAELPPQAIKAETNVTPAPGIEQSNTQEGATPVVSSAPTQPSEVNPNNSADDTHQPQAVDGKATEAAAQSSVSAPILPTAPAPSAADAPNASVPSVPQAIKEETTIALDNQASAKAPTEPSSIKPAEESTESANAVTTSQPKDTYTRTNEPPALTTESATSSPIGTDSGSSTISAPKPVAIELPVHSETSKGEGGVEALNSSLIQLTNLMKSYNSAT